MIAQKDFPDPPEEFGKDVLSISLTYSSYAQKFSCTLYSIWRDKIPIMALE